ncbi:HEAT repeat domain-containing protein [Paenibacillus elgii]|uniref:HEAT repeat domain-containing protein n=1 Tax=Paenibacillus elgii TaxID=189691 RepID=UPI0020420CFB|nr:HEAT repeat domain-containing protein [Paenibacillus elgii]MCM3270652.1 HEAT repeat domain-containing protein [Paenibacillus elgii]
MNSAQAIMFLKNNQPFSRDTEAKFEVIQKYNDVRVHFLNHPDPQCIPLFLNSFGEGSGFGVYQLIEEVLMKFSVEQVLPHLITALKSEHTGVRYWCSHIAASFPNPSLLAPLTNLLRDPDPDIRCAAVTALSQIEDDRIIGVLTGFLEKQEDPDVIDLIQEALNESKIEAAIP